MPFNGKQKNYRADSTSTKNAKMTIQHSDYKSGNKTTGLDSDKPGFKYQLQYLRQSYLT